MPTSARHTNAVTSHYISQSNSSVMSSNSIPISTPGDRHLQDHGQTTGLTSTARNGHRSNQFMSNQLIPFDNPSPESPALVDDVDFSLPSPKPDIMLNPLMQRSQSLPSVQTLHTTSMTDPNVDSESGVTVSNRNSDMPWYSASTTILTPEPQYTSLQPNGPHAKGNLNKIECLRSNSCTPISLGDIADRKQFTPDMMYSTGQLLDNPTFTPSFKTEPDLMESHYGDGHDPHEVIYRDHQRFQDGPRFHHSSGKFASGMPFNEKHPGGIVNLGGDYVLGDGSRRMSDSINCYEHNIHDSSRFSSSNVSNNNSGLYSGEQSSDFMHNSHSQQFDIHHTNAADLERRIYMSPPLLSPSTASMTSSSSREPDHQKDTNISGTVSDLNSHPCAKRDARSSSSSSLSSGPSKHSKPSRGAQNLPPCRVCGNKASGLHFGVNTCEACNEFFRRSLKRGASYYCTKNRECQVYGKKRNACSYCRYHRCVEMGMSRDAIKTGRYSHKTRTEYAMEVEEFKQKEMNRAESEKYEVLIADLVKFHDKYINHTTRVPYDELYKKQSTYLQLYQTQKEHELRHPPLSNGIKNKRLLMCWPAEQEDLTLTMHDVEMTERWLRNYINYAKNVPGFKELALSDQASLVRGSWFEFWFLGAYRGYNSKLEIVVYPNGRCFHKDEIIKVFGREYTEFSFYLADRMRSMKVTPEEKVLIKTVCLTFPDRAPLENREAVEKMHWLMVSCLLHTLERNRPGDTAIFPVIVSKLVELRTLTDVAMRAHKSALFQDVLKDSPLLCEMVDTKTLYVQCSAHKNGVQPATECPG